MKLLLLIFFNSILSNLEFNLESFSNTKHVVRPIIVLVEFKKVVGKKLSQFKKKSQSAKLIALISETTFNGSTLKTSVKSSNFANIANSFLKILDVCLTWWKKIQTKCFWAYIKQLNTMTFAQHFWVEICIIYFQNETFVIRCYH